MILFRYLAKEVLVSMLAVSFTLLAIVMSGRFVKYLSQAASGDLPPEVLMAVMAYRLPSFLELVLPLGFFIGILLAYGRLYVESEMTVMSACGLTTRRLALYTLIPSALVAVVVGYFSLYASPHGIYQVQEILEETKNKSGLEILVAGRFRVDKKTGRVTYIHRLSDDRQVMEDVFSAEQTVASDGSVELNVILAEEGRIKTDPESGDRFIVLNDGYSYLWQLGSLALQVTGYDQYGQLYQEQQQQSHKYKKADARPTRKLIKSKKLVNKATLQWRISLIILVPILALIAQALSKTTHRKGRYVKMLPAFLLYILYLVLLTAARDAVEKEKIPLEIGLWWVHGLFLIIAVVLLFGGDWYRQWQNRRASFPAAVDTAAEGGKGS